MCSSFRWTYECLPSQPIEHLAERVGFALKKNSVTSANFDQTLKGKMTYMKAKKVYAGRVSAPLHMYTWAGGNGSAISCLTTSR